MQTGKIMNKIIRTILTKSIYFFFLLFAQQLYAQSGSLKGTVKDAKGTALPNVSITVQGKKIGTTTDLNGNYSLKLPIGTFVIVASHVGQKDQAAQVDIVDGGITEKDFVANAIADLDGVIVIGTRSRNTRTKMTTPVPVDVLNISQLTRELPQSDLSQLLSYTTPSFQSARQTVSDGTDHLDPTQLRGLGSDQVLVLINGKRRHQAALVNVNGTVNRGQVGTDFDAIPIASIERIEILRDGAAAQYGSDAIAGVVNVILKKRINALSGSFSFGEHVTHYTKDYAAKKLGNTSIDDKSVTDGANFNVQLNYGFALGKKGFINLSGNYSLRDKTNRTGTYTGAVYALSNGAKDDSILNARSLTRNNFDMRIGNSRIASGGLMLNGEFALSNNWALKLFGGFNQKAGDAAGFFRYPSSITSGAANYADKALALYPNGFLPLIQTAIKDYWASVSIDGTIGKWNASFSNTIGTNNFSFIVDNSINYTQLELTDHPQTKFDAGSLQFLQNTLNADLSRSFDVLSGLNIGYGAEFRIDHYAQKAGEEASYKNYNTNSAATPAAQVFAGFTPAYATSHSRNNLGVYIDLEQSFTKSWLVELAARFENYSDFGSTLNYKLASRYTLGKVVTIRGAASTGFRAPSLQQKYYAKTNTIFVSTPNGLVPTEIGTFPNDSKPAAILGIPALKEETSNNYSIGITSTPVKGLEISLDAYLIKIKDRIVLTNNFDGGNNAALAQQLKDNGANKANFFTNAIDTKAKGFEASINYHLILNPKNSIRFSVAATFLRNEVRKGADGKPIIHASTVLINSGQLGNYFNREDQSRVEVASPTSKANLSVNYTHKKWQAMLRFARFGKVVYIDPSIDPNIPANFPVNAYSGKKESLDQEFGAKTITDLSLSYQLTKNISWTIGANNLLDVYPDEHVHSGNVSLGRFIYSRRVQQMGFNGRFLFARAAFNF